MKTADSPRLGDVLLPSSGLVYGGQIPNGEMQVTPMVTTGEKIILDGETLFEVQSEYLARHCKFPEGCKLTQMDLLTGDRLFLFFMVRAASYGPLYDYEYTCRSCRSVNDGTVDTSKLPIKRWEESDNIQEPFELTLPASGDVIGFRLSRGWDEKALYAFHNSKDADKKTAKNFQLARCLESVNGEYIDRSSRELKIINDQKSENYIGKLTGLDSSIYVMAMEAAEPGLDLELSVTCKRITCRTENRVIVGPDKDFFRASRSLVPKYFKGAS